MEHAEQEFNRKLSTQEQHVESLLAEVFSVNTPENLVDRLVHASSGALSVSIESLETQLDEALRAPAPEGLAARVYSTSVVELCHEQPLIVARISPSIAWRQLALAACVLFAVLVAVRFSGQPLNHSNEQPQFASNGVLSVEDEELLFDDLNLSEYAYLADTRELAFADVAIELNNLRADIELWQYGLLSE